MDSYTANERKAHGKRLARARTALDDASRIAQNIARSAHNEGVPETQIAAELGVTRMTVRKWLGKQSRITAVIR